MVNKIIDKNSVSHDINDARIASLDDVKPSISGTSLVIPAQEGPEPVAVIDGVAYFHKHEFNLEDESTDEYMLNILTGDTRQEGEMIACLQHKLTMPAREYVFVLILGWTTWGEPRSYSLTGPYADFTSKSLTPVMTREDMDSDAGTKILLPTCSAFYGELSADGKTFTSYFNLKSDGGASKIDSIQQGNSKMPIVDDRLPEPTAQDADKILKVGATGEYELGEAGGGEPTPLEVDVYQENVMSSVNDVYDGLANAGISDIAYARIRYGVGYTDREITAWFQIGGGGDSRTLWIYADKLEKGQLSSLNNYVSWHTYETSPNFVDFLNATAGDPVFHTLPDYTYIRSGKYALELNNGALSWQEDVPSSGIQLYQHDIVAGNYQVRIISMTETAINAEYISGTWQIGGVSFDEFLSSPNVIKMSFGQAISGGPKTTIHYLAQDSTHDNALTAVCVDFYAGQARLASSQFFTTDLSGTWTDTVTPL